MTTTDARMPTTSARLARLSRRRRRLIGTIAGYAAIVLLLIPFVFPLLVMLFTAVKTSDDIFSSPPQLLPTQWDFGNFAAAFEAMPFLQYLGNTVFLAAMCVLGSLIAVPMVAYSLSRVRWRGRRIVFGAVLATMMLPPQVTMIPTYLLWNKLELTGTYVPLIVPSFLGIPFLIYMVRQFFMSFPEDLIEAARLDGASEFRIYWSIVLPLCRPALATAAVFQFVWVWTDFLGPLLYVADAKLYTLSLGVYAFFSNYGVAWGPLMAACTLFALPAVVIFVLAQKHFVGGLKAGAFK